MKTSHVVALVLVLAVASKALNVYSMKTDHMVMLIALGVSALAVGESVESFTGSHANVDADAWVALNAIVKAIATSEDGGTLVIPSNLKVLGKLTIAHDMTAPTTNPDQAAILQFGDSNRPIENATFKVDGPGKTKPGVVQTSNIFEKIQSKSLWGKQTFYNTTTRTNTEFPTNEIQAADPISA